MVKFQNNNQQQVRVMKQIVDNLSMNNTKFISRTTRADSHIFDCFFRSDSARAITLGKTQVIVRSHVKTFGECSSEPIKKITISVICFP